MASRCELYLSIPASFSGAPALLEAALAAGRVPSLLIVGTAAPDRLRALAAAAHRQNAAVLIENDAGLAKALGLDGVHVRLDGPELRQVRDAVGPDAIVGADCGLSRHDAMEMAEAGADYIAFGTKQDTGAESIDDLAEMIGWWSGLIEMPCAAHLPAGADASTWQTLVEEGADFMMPGADLWDEPESAGEMVKRFAAYCGLERARTIL